MYIRPLHQRQHLQTQTHRLCTRHSNNNSIKTNSHCHHCIVYFFIKTLYQIYFTYLIFFADVTNVPPAEPLFVTVPPRPQRVLHSEAYIKYIEGLQNESRFITPWEKTLKTTQETALNVDVAKLPSHWLRPSIQQKPDEVANALWQLRNFMMKDILQFQRSSY